MDKYCFIILVLTIAQVYSDNIIASITQLEDVYHIERQTLLHLENHINRLLEHINEIKEKIREIKESRSHITDVAEYLQNPLNSFVYVRSMTEYLPIIYEFLEPVFDITNLLDDVESLGGWPTEKDMEGAARAILRLQSTYSLNVDQLIQGRIHNYHSSALTANDCKFIAETALTKGLYQESLAWIKKTLELCNKSDAEENCKELKISVMEYYAYAKFKFGDLEKALELTNNLLEFDSNHTRAKTNKIYLNHEINNVPSSQRTGEFMLDPYGKIDSQLYYYYSCRSLTRPDKQVASQLKCQYVHYNNPYLKIGPIKEEEAFLNPRIVLIRDIIYDSEIREIQNMSKPMLQTSATVAGVLDDVRVSKVAWLYSQHSELSDKLIIRFSAYADLSKNSAEALQVVNYGLGGHYLAHYDAYDEKTSWEKWGTDGNRIATLLVYINDVDEGGNTVFNKLGLSVKPEKGTAVLWYNLNNDGNLDPNTLHAACPVLVGTKWAINLWFHEAWNDVKRPCLPKNK